MLCWVALPQSQRPPIFSPIMEEQLRQFMRQGLGIREVLQIVENALSARGAVVMGTLTLR